MRTTTPNRAKLQQHFFMCLQKMCTHSKQARSTALCAMLQETYLTSWKSLEQNTMQKRARPPCATLKILCARQCLDIASSDRFLQWAQV